HIAKALPDYMIPSAYVLLDRLPLSPNGKLDRKALPNPVFSTRQGRRPSTESEKRIAALFAQSLRLDVTDIHADDDFFELGGHSLTARQLLKLLRDVWGASFAGPVPGLGVIFTVSTVARRASRLDSALAPALPASFTHHEGLPPRIRLNPGNDAPPLFCIHPAG